MKNKDMKILIIGDGGRESALAWKVNKSPRVGKIYVSPGNGGTRRVARNIKINPTDVTNLVQFALMKEIDLTIVGPENSLERGIVDVFQGEGLNIFGPTQFMARIESSKAFAKDFMTNNRIPTADYWKFESISKASDFAKKQKMPIVIKASGLTSGKGVFICKDFDDISNALDKIEKIFEDFPNNEPTIIVEEYLEGSELSILAFCDGTDYVLMPPTQDHKRLLDGNKGSNTGGMGAYGPVSWVSKEVLDDIGKQTIEPILKGFKDTGHYYKGVLYAGIMITNQGIKVLEYNARFGDPETQVVMSLLETDLIDIIEACLSGTLKDLEIKWKNKSAVCVVLASEGYPEKPVLGYPIFGLNVAPMISGVKIFHAGTIWKRDAYYTSGGRVLGVTGIADNIETAEYLTYNTIEKYLNFIGMQYRHDIGPS